METASGSSLLGTPHQEEKRMEGMHLLEGRLVTIPAWVPAEAGAGAVALGSDGCLRRS